MKKYRFVLVLALALVALLGLTIAAQAVNPYMDLWEHVPDGEPHVFGDRVYVYGSHDVFETRMCGPNYVVWSAPLDDLTNWKYEGISFDGGESGYLLAPDACQGPDGKYYIYAFGDCDQGGKGKTFCAVSDKPEGPFEYLGPVTIDGKAQMIFDPAVLVDDDGSVYLFGGASNIYKLDPTDMRTVIEGPFQVQEDDGKGNLVQIRNFQEGSSIRKVDDWYVFVYASKYDLTTDHLTNNTNNKDYYNGTMEYAYSKTIYGPYTYGGTLIDNGGEVLNPTSSTIERTNYNGNTHGGMAKINGQWYLFYHRQTNDCQTYRQGMCEPLNVTVTADGVQIEQAEMTSQGAEKDGLNPEKEYSAGIACYLTNFAYINTDVEMYDTLTPVTNIRNSATVGYKYFNFTGKDYELSVSIRPNGIAGQIDMVLDDPENEPVASFTLKGDASDAYTTLTASCGKLSGKHAVFFNFYAVSQDEICDFGSFGFRDASFHFEDVKDLSQYYYAPVYWAVDEGVTTGTSETRFSPDAGCTRAQVVTFLWRAAGEPEPTAAANPFGDVSADQYYYKAVLWAVEKGITKGMTADTFAPDATCTRGQIVTFLWRFKDQPKAETTENPFKDVPAGEYYTDAVMWAVEKGVTKGTSADKFSPDSTCTRAQIVTFLYRAMR